MGIETIDNIVKNLDKLENRERWHERAESQDSEDRDCDTMAVRRTLRSRPADRRVVHGTTVASVVEQLSQPNEALPIALLEEMAEGVDVEDIVVERSTPMIAPLGFQTFGAGPMVMGAEAASFLVVVVGTRPMTETELVESQARFDATVAERERAQAAAEANKKIDAERRQKRAEKLRAELAKLEAEDVPE